ncbi:MAG TPA: Holliday junction branch migration protein RuvA [Firmicutes bacterium]|jgi:Holliday junction DNA helicase RuvA|nr:Holliday junction branch migration protein RuvA [Bacillota bacterium]
MISQLRGKVASIERDAIVLDVGGIGFSVSVTSGTRATLGRIGEEVRLFTAMVIRDDCVNLYGFESVEEREFFHMLCEVKGIGPKTALSILSSLSPETLSMAISSGDIAMLATAPGVGKRTAERLAVELKGKVGQFISDEFIERGASANADSTAAQDAISALVSLGYLPVEAERAVAAAVAAGYSDDASAIIRAALSRMSRAE